MKTTMKNHGHLNKIRRNLCKITLQLVMASFILAFASCEKEDIFKPDQKVQEVEESVKATAKIVPELSLEIRLRRSNASYDYLYSNRTVIFNGSFFYAKTIIRGVAHSEIWWSPNGLDWGLARTNAFPLIVEKMVVFNEKIWAIGRQVGTGDGLFKIYNSRDGFNWHLVSSGLPFIKYAFDDAIVFKNKIFVFEGVPEDEGQNIHSSSDGINWTLETTNAYPHRAYGKPIVFKDTLYYLGGSGRGPGITNEIWKSHNGRIWSKVSGSTPSLIRPTEDFPVKIKHSAVVHNNAVWVTGGDTTGHYYTKSNDIWVSSDMKNWTKYGGRVPFDPHIKTAMLSYDNKILLVGGLQFPAGGGSKFSKSIWSIKQKSSVRFPIEIPREYPTIPRY